MGARVCDTYIGATKPGPGYNIYQFPIPPDPPASLSPRPTSPPPAPHAAVPVPPLLLPTSISSEPTSWTGSFSVRPLLITTDYVCPIVTTNSASKPQPSPLTVMLVASTTMSVSLTSKFSLGTTFSMTYGQTPQAFGAPIIFQGI